ncbi:MAG: AMP-binding protein [Pseudomonadota bacterium]
MNRLDLSETRERTFPHILRRQAEENGTTPFLIDETQSISYAEAERISAALAAGMHQLGVAKGDRVGLYLGNCPEFVLLTLAANKLGAIWVPVNTDYRGEWLRDTLERSRCKLLCVDAERAERLAELGDVSDYGMQLWVGEGADESSAQAVARYSALSTGEPLQGTVEQDYGDTCAILWTSGTTGKSKGVMQNYNGWIRAIDQGASPMFDSRPGDVVYCALPLFNTGAWITSVYRALLEGLPCVIEPRFSVSDFWQRVERFGATQMFLIGAMGVFLWQQEARDGDADTPLRRAMIVPFPPDLWEPFEQRFGLQIITAGLGMSECQLIANQLHATVDLPPYALGYPPDDIELQLCDDDGEPVPDGEAGEICVKPLAPHVLFNGYFDNPDATAAAFRNGYFLTGDMARRDPASGALFFVDRKKDVVRFAGRNISTLEVEGVLRRHPDIADVAAFGIPAEEVESEDELKLNVVLKEGAALTPEALCTFINENAPHYFVPRYLEFVNSLPYTPTNKVQKFKLRQDGITAATWDRRNSGFQVTR